MAPPPPRTRIPKEKFSSLFGSLKTQAYHDNAPKGPGHTIRSIGWNANGSLVATASADRMVRVWNPERPNVRYSTELRGHTSSVERVAFHPSRTEELATCSRDGTVRFWDVRTKACVHTITLGGDLTYLTWSTDGEYVLVGSMQDTLTPIKVSPTHPDPLPMALASHREKSSLNINQCIFPFSRPPRSVLMTNSDGEVNICEWPTWEHQLTIRAHTSSCLSLALAPSGKYLAIGGSDSLISLYDTKDWICRRTLTSPNSGAIKAVSFSFDGSYVVGAWELDKESQGGLNQEGRLELPIYHVETGDIVHTILPGSGRGTETGVSAVAWHPLRYWLAYSIADPTSGGGLRIVGAAGPGGQTI